ncbi:MAG: hypothetical protein ACREC0_11125 [Methylocella sp.]
MEIRVRQSKLIANKPYTGILAQPMPKWTVLTRPTDEEVTALIDAKFKAVFANYEIDPTDAFEAGPKMASAWANLAWHLAREHVPGFRGPPRGRGKPATRKSDDATLVIHVELLKRRDGLSDRKAIKRIAAQNLVSGTEQTLRQRYKRAKKLFESMSRLYDNFAAAKGRDALVRVMEESLSGDEKDTFLSPD